jgi:modulator of FtsH protease
MIKNDVYINSSEKEKKYSLSEFIKLTYQLFAATMLSGAAGSYIGINIASAISNNYWLISIPWILFGIFGLNKIKRIYPLNYIVLFIFTFIGGLLLGPLLNVFLVTKGSGLIANAFITSAIIFGLLSIYSMNTKKDFSEIGKPLAIALFIILVSIIVNIFFLKNSFFYAFLEGMIVLVMSGFIIFDTQNIINRRYETPIDGAIELYLNFFNLFSSILQLFGFFGED